jgi:hypothetical protein
LVVVVCFFLLLVDGDAVHKVGYGAYVPAESELSWVFSGGASGELCFYYLYLSGDEQTVLRMQCANIMWGPKLDWAYTRATRLLQANDYALADELEGHDASWKVKGDMPLPVAGLLCMFTRVQTLRQQRHHHLNRTFTRCNKFVMASRANIRLCAACTQRSPTACVCCERTDAAVPTRFCKTCTPRQNFCAKCATPLKGSQTKALLCAGVCGLGRGAENCCRMIPS